ncbi:hypothetical protein FDP41_002061 [Naegleria fowleri]|uniref:Ras guanine nucleotide exchange factor glfB-like C-terminal domain-containing protein n=1 Tax=Naegleria fowleri TaxID=5763 RepID=A0A6A5BWX7_NAEFO|nr:uncharacterized protein FDP41_002061 [Naegleria fowleri]KAF0978991.1 hypothetical protein FDP41_002061 [Naegleria fowleri]CAG4708090.1 unnamed protein product [Naegleria fowleri]
MGTKQTKEAKKTSPLTIDTSSQVDGVHVGESVRNIFQQKLCDLPVAKDLLRLCNKISIFEVNTFSTDQMFSYPNIDELQLLNYRIKDLNKEDDDIENGEDDIKFENKFTRVIHSILTVLVQEIESINENRNEQCHTCCTNGNHIASLSCHMFEKEVNLNNFQSLEQFMLNYFGEESPVVTVLKLCNQSIIAPAVIALKKQLGQLFRYKDSGYWFIDILINKNGGVTVCHRRKERVTSHAFDHTSHSQSYPSLPSASQPVSLKKSSVSTTALPKPKNDISSLTRKLYTFEWRLYINLSPSTLTQLDSIRLELVDHLDFSDSEILYSEEERENIERIFFEHANGFFLKFDRDFEQKVLDRKRKQAKK